ncbi:MAG: glutamate formimidoyltransferase [candidate division Zixibacteria bacterium]|nr:glutamate formimidoyltransferase [candidate division Zixibacteria bacterium]
MARMVECVPNFSEGRRPEIIEKIVAEIKKIEGVAFLDKEMDKDHNRAVVSFVGSPEGVKEAALAAISKATELIDMNKHTGEHPRIGATDVVPLIPIAGVSMEECVKLAHELAREVAEKLNIPIYLYEEAATRSDRVNLAEIRKGEYEELKKEIETNPDRKPDYGPAKMHPTAGAMVIGARMPLIAFNVYLGTKDVGIAKKIASAIRFGGGGLRYVKALGFAIKERGLVQVSMNLVNYLGTPIFRVFEMVKSEADRYGVSIISSEVVGLTPMGALVDVADFYLKLENFKKEQILENRLMHLASTQNEGLDDFMCEVASSSPAPGGGSVAAISGSLGAALCSMVCRLTIGKKKYAEFEEELKGVLEKSENLLKELKELVTKDAESFNAVMDARKLSQRDEEEIARRTNTIQEATKRAALVPIEVMEKSLEVLSLSRIVAEKGNPNAVSDAGVSALMAKAAMEGAYLNVRINLPSIEDREFVASTKEKADKIRQDAEILIQEVKRIVDDKIG